MDCEICKQLNKKQLVILSIKKEDGSLCTIACLECAKKSSAFCEKHNMPHLGFAGDSTTACMLCIEETVIKERNKTPEVCATLKQALPEENFKELLEWAEKVSELTGNSSERCILRAVVTIASRFDKTIKEVLEDVVRTKDVNTIFPWSI